MASNSTSEYKVIADKIVSPDEDIIVQVVGDVYKGSIAPGNKYITASEAGGGSSADIADFVFVDEGSEDGSSITISNKDMILRTTRDDSETDADITLQAADDVFIEAQGDDVSINANNNVRLNAYNENVQINAAGYTIFINSDVYLGDNIPEKQVAKIEDIGIETSFTVVGGSTGTQPTFSSDPLFTGNYVRMSSNLVHFEIQVDFDNITSFGTGQYYLDLPFPAKFAYQLTAGCLHDQDTGREYAISGHVAAGESRLYLQSTDTQGGAVFNIDFTSTAPVTLTTADNLHISGTYIAADL